MNENYYEKIENYLNGEMSTEEKSLFEAALSADKELLSTFKVYRTIESDMRVMEQNSLQENALKNTLQSLNKEYFENESLQVAKVIPLYSNQLFKIMMALAASITIILVAYLSFFQSEENIQLLADTYFKENLQEISQFESIPEDTLQFGIAGNKREQNATQDSLRVGITAYNNQEFLTALRYFRGVSTNYPESKEARKYIGLVYLSTKNYDKALREFDELANKKDLPSNPGLFLKAITLMRRNQQGDKQEAKQLLQQAVEAKAAGSQEAEQWLQKF